MTDEEPRKKICYVYLSETLWRQLIDCIFMVQIVWAVQNECIAIKWPNFRTQTKSMSNLTTIFRAKQTLKLNMKLHENNILIKVNLSFHFVISVSSHGKISCYFCMPSSKIVTILYETIICRNQPILFSKIILFMASVCLCCCCSFVECHAKCPKSVR